MLMKSGMKKGYGYNNDLPEAFQGGKEKHVFTFIAAHILN